MLTAVLRVLLIVLAPFFVASVILLLILMDTPPEADEFTCECGTLLRIEDKQARWLQCPKCKTEHLIRLFGKKGRR